MAKSDTIERKILFDNPSESDRFSGGGHSRAASSLAHAIRQFDGRDRAIGLEGKWGAGKSTIVRLAETELESDESPRNFHVFTFDMWGNQPAHFRRAFLESLISWALIKFPKSEKCLEKKRKLIGGRHIETSTKQYPKLSWFGLAAFIFVFLLPVIYTWLSPFALLDKQAGTTQPAAATLPDISALPVEPAWPGGTQLSIAAIGLMVLIALVAIGFRYNAERKKNKGILFAISQVLMPFSEKAEEADIDQDVREEDPTQHEFEKHFREIVGKLQSDKDRLIIVFDNIDRLPKDTIATAWSDIRGVLVSGRVSEYEGDQSITIIVPYDRQHILQSVETQSGANSGDSDSPKVRHEKQDVLRKSFDAIFHVSPPILSDASAFFHEQFKEALNGHYEEESAKRVYRIFDMYMQDLGEPATPRQLIHFINSVTAIWEQRQAMIPLEAIAVYVVRRDDIESNPANLRDPGLIAQRYVDQANVPDLRKVLAALAYNVEVELGYQVLLDGEIERVFTTGTAEEVAKLAEAPGFDDMLHVVFEEKAERWARESLESYGNAATALLNLEKSDAIKWRSEKALLNQIHDLKEVSLDDLEEHGSVFNVLALPDDGETPRVFRLIVGWIERCLPKSEESQNFAAGQNWIQALGDMVRVLEQRGDDGQINGLLKTIEVPGGWEFLFGAAHDVVDLDFRIRDFAGEPNAAALAEHLPQQAMESPGRFRRIWSELGDYLSGAQAENILQKLAEHLQSTSHSDDVAGLRDKLGSFIEVFAGYSYAKSKRKNILRQLVENGALYQHVKDAVGVDARKEDLVAIRADVAWLVISAFGADGPPEKDYQGHALGNITAAARTFADELKGGEFDDAEVKRIAEDVRKWKQVSVVIAEAAKESAQQRLLRHVLIEAIRQLDEGNLPQSDPVLQNYSFLKDLLEDEFDGFLSFLGNHWNEERWNSIKFENVPPALVHDVSDRTEAGWRNFLERIDDWLQKTTPDEWNTALEDNSSRLEILRHRVSDAKLEVPATNLFQPLIDHFVAIVGGEKEPPSGVSFDVIVAALPTSTRSNIKLDFLEHLRNVPVDTNGAMAGLAAYPETFKELPITRAPATAISRILKPMIQDGSEDAQEYIEGRAADWKQVLEDDPEKQKGTIKELLEGYLQSGDDVKKSRAEAMKSAIGIRIRKKKSSTESS